MPARTVAAPVVIGVDDSERATARRSRLWRPVASSAELLTLDEPISGLDPLTESVFQDCVREARSAGRTVLLSSHVLAEVGPSIAFQIGMFGMVTVALMGIFTIGRHTRAAASDPRPPPGPGGLLSSTGPRATNRGLAVPLDVVFDAPGQTRQHVHQRRGEPHTQRTVRPLDRVDDEAARTAPEDFGQLQSLSQAEPVRTARRNRGQETARDITPPVQSTRARRRREARVDDDRKGDVLPECDQPTRVSVTLRENGAGRGHQPLRGAVPQQRDGSPTHSVVPAEIIADPDDRRVGARLHGLAFFP